MSIYYISDDDELFNAVDQVIKEKLNDEALLLDLYRNVGHISVYHDRTRDEDMKLAEEIIRIVARTLHLNVDTLVSRNRYGKYAEGRHICAYLIQKNTVLPLKMIGQVLGGRDHSTVINSIRQYNAYYDSDENFRDRVELVEEAIKSMPIGELVDF